MMAEWKILALRAIDEYTDAELQAELQQRWADRDKGNCDYCHRHYGMTPCRFPERHAAAGEQFHRGWKIEIGGNYVTIRRWDDECSISLSRYGSPATLFKRDPECMNIGTGIGELEMCPIEDDERTDRERSVYVIDWAIDFLAALDAKKDEKDEN